MKVINQHKRIINQPVSIIGAMLTTLATANDLMIATNKWPAMKLDKGLQIGSKGGHGPIKYFVKDYQPEKQVTFQFDMPGFDGFHQFELIEISENQTELSHLLQMKTTGLATLKWVFVIRWLHDAYIEDCFTKVENSFLDQKKTNKWSWWVKKLRKILTPKKN